MTESLGPNVVVLQPAVCKVLGANGALRVDHSPILIDPSLEFVACGTCGERLNPMHVLRQYAHAESRFAARWAELRTEIEKLKFKAERQNRVRCEHCAKLTRIKK